MQTRRRQGRCQRSLPSLATRHTKVRPFSLMPIEPAPEQNDPPCTVTAPGGGPAGSTGATGAWVAGAWGERVGVASRTGAGVVVWAGAGVGGRVFAGFGAGVVVRSATGVGGRVVVGFGASVLVGRVVAVSV